MSQMPSVSSGIGPPDSEECRNSSDLGRLYHDSERDIWYECEFDRRHGVFTWVILPPTDSPNDGT
jgi:hypothetical protein